MSESNEIGDQQITAPAGLSEANRKVYNDMVQYMKLKLQRPVTAAKVVMLIASGVKFLSDVKTMTGPEKKDLVIHALRETVYRSSYINEDDKIALIEIIDTFADGLIEHLVDFAADAYTFIKTKVKGISWCPSCIKGSDTSVSIHDRSSALAQTRNLEEYKTLKDYIKLKLQLPVNGPKVISVVAAGVKYIEYYRDLSGAEKKDIVINSTRDVIQESVLVSDADRTALIKVLDTLADETIDYLVEFGQDKTLKHRFSKKN